MKQLTKTFELKTYEQVPICDDCREVLEAIGPPILNTIPHIQTFRCPTCLNQYVLEESWWPKLITKRVEEERE